MAIEFNGVPPSQLPKAGGDKQVKANRDDTNAPQNTPERPAASDKISLTDAAARLRELEQRLADLSGVDGQRVEAIKQAIADGSYQVDPKRVADALLALESVLHVKPKK